MKNAQLQAQRASQALPCLMKTCGALLSVPLEDDVQLVQDTRHDTSDEI